MMENNPSIRKIAAIRGTALVAVIALFGSACGSTSGSSAAELVEWFEGQGETTEAAECWANELSSYSLADLDAFETAENEDDIPNGLLAHVLVASRTCADL
ncbi:MAG: hypothetical protein GXP35_02290 [Actinobacteria bacterium]|nr:hypothetical protein [Actinomycetota bacterium]